MNMFPSNNISNSSSSLSEEPTLSSVGHDFVIFSNNPLQHHHLSTAAPPPLPLPPLQMQKIKKKRSLPGNPDPESEVIALSPKSLLATNRFICEICNKGFQRDQNLQLHRRGHNLPWKLKQRDSKEEVRKKVYVCPEPTCVHHHPSRALGDLTGIKKHFCRKHGEKKWKCGKCAKVYAVQSDWKAHSKTCGTREYKCDCGTIFSRKDSFITHRAFCDALAEESARILLSNQGQGIVHAPSSNSQNHPLLLSSSSSPPPHFPFTSQNPNPNPNSTSMENPLHISYQNPSNYIPTTIITNPLIHTYRQYYGELAQSLQNPTHQPSAHLSATALLQKAATARSIEPPQSRMAHLDMKEYELGSWFVQKSDIQGQTRDFLGLNGSVNDSGRNGSVGSAQVSVTMGELLNYTRGCTGSRNPSFGESDQVSVVKPLPINVGYGLAESNAIAASKIWG